MATRSGSGGIGVTSGGKDSAQRGAATGTALDGQPRPDGGEAVPQ